MCQTVLESVREYNEHYQAEHPRTPCPDCPSRFIYPRMKKKHQYTHYEAMYECAVCDKRFSFKSEYEASQKLHIGDQGHSCFKPKVLNVLKGSLSKINSSNKTHRSNVLKIVVTILIQIFVMYGRMSKHIATTSRTLVLCAVKGGKNRKNATSKNARVEILNSTCDKYCHILSYHHYGA